MPNPAALRALVSGADEAGDAVRRVIRAYHGSPYSFDRFDASKIGAGEGAQAYGHGLYFAGSEPVADVYRTSVSALRRTPQEDALEFWRRHAEISGNKQKAVLDALDHAEGSLDEAAGMPEAEQRWKDIIQHLYELDFRQPLPKRPGHMYEVEIGYPEEALLDWDKPVWAQSERVTDGLKRVDPRSFGAFPRFKEGPYGGWLWGTQQRTLLGSPDPAADPALLNFWDTHKGSRHAGAAFADLEAMAHGRPEASLALRDAGIPGIRYLDQGSRSAGEGTRNYVMFPGTEDRIRILRKYGLLAPMGAGMMGGEE